ncbi:hypothetical protein ES707_22574 [subsurface metagenome]
MAPFGNSAVGFNLNMGAVGHYVGIFLDEVRPGKCPLNIPLA